MKTTLLSLILFIPLLVLSSSFKELKLKHDIKNHFERTIVEAKFISTKNETFLFKFPLPDTATFTALMLTVGGIEFYGKVVDLKSAQIKFNETVSKGKSGSIITNSGREYVLQIALRPNIETILKVTYEYIIPLEENFYNLNFMINTLQKPDFFQRNISIYEPSSIITLINPQNISLIHENSLKQATLFHTEFSAVSLKYQINSTLNETDEFYCNSKYFVHTFSPKHLPSIPSVNIFVIDYSGSMSGSMENVKLAFNKIINTLDPTAQFNVIGFEVTPFYWRSGVVAATEANKQSAISFVNSKSAGGATNIYDSLIGALNTLGEGSKEKIGRIIFLSDGEPNTGTVTSKNEIIRLVTQNNIYGYSIYSLAFGVSLDFEFLRVLSAENYGYAVRIHPLMDVTLQLSKFFKTIKRPVMKNVHFRYSLVFNDTVSLDKRLFFEGTDIVITGKFKNSNPQNVEININGTMNNNAIFQKVKNLVISERTDQYVPIERIYALKKALELRNLIKKFDSTDYNYIRCLKISLEYQLVIDGVTGLIVTELDGENPLVPSNPWISSSGNISYGFIIIILSCVIVLIS